MEGEEEIPWPQSFPDLERLDQLLRCGICYDFVRTALMTPCSHNFCSLCIRKYMQYKTSCPACLVETVENQLRNNRILDELVAVLERLQRPLCQALMRQQCPTSVELGQPLSSKAVDVAISSKISFNSTKFTEIGTLQSTSKSKIESPWNLPSTAPTHEQNLEMDLCNSASSSSLNHMNTPMPSNISLKSPSSSMSTLGTSNSMASPQKSARTIVEMLKSPMKKSTNFIPMVACPVCSVDIPEQNINRHLDDCLKNKNTAPLQRVNSKLRRPLPKLVYRLLNDKDLRKKLVEHKLNTQGDRKTLEKRHQRYTVLYNSECDKMDPRPVSEIIKQLEREEKEGNRSGCKTWTSLQVDRKADPKDIEKAQKQYLKENKSSYDSLIAELRERQQRAKKEKSSASTNASVSDEFDNVTESSSRTLAPISTVSSSTSESCIDVSASCTSPKTSSSSSQMFVPESSRDQGLSSISENSIEKLPSQNRSISQDPTLHWNSPGPSCSKMQTREFQLENTRDSTSPSLLSLQSRSPSPLLLFHSPCKSSRGSLQQYNKGLESSEEKCDKNSSLLTRQFRAKSLSPPLPQSTFDLQILQPLKIKKSPVLGRKRFSNIVPAEQSHSVVPNHRENNINTSIAIVDISDDSNSTVFSESDFDHIDAVISQHNSSINYDSQISERITNNLGPTNTDSFTKQLNGYGDESSTDSESLFQMQPQRSTTHSKNPPVIEVSQKRTRKRIILEQSNEPRRSSRKKPRPN